MVAQGSALLQHGAQVTYHGRVARVELSRVDWTTADLRPPALRVRATIPTGLLFWNGRAAGSQDLLRE